jgi:hypothetical protein
MDLTKWILFKLLFLIVLFFILLMTEIVPASNNILLNPGFEDTPSGQDPAFPPWWEWCDPSEENKGAAEGEVTDEEARSGERSALRYVEGKALSCYSQTIEVVPGEILECGIWIKTSKDFKGAEAYLRIEFKTKGHIIIQAIESKRVVSPSQPWKLYTIETSPAPSGVALASFCLFLRGEDENAEGKAWFDDGYIRLKLEGLI